MSETTEALSKEALSALMSTGTNRQGAVPTFMAEEVREELVAAGMLGPGGGLTRSGSIAREREADRLMDELFPL